MRYYGFLSPTAKMPLEEVKARVELAYGFTVTVPERLPAEPETFVCKLCGGALRFDRALRAGWRDSVRERITGDEEAGALSASG